MVVGPTRAERQAFEEACDGSGGFSAINCHPTQERSLPKCRGSDCRNCPTCIKKKKIEATSLLPRSRTVSGVGSDSIFEVKGGVLAVA